MDANEKLWEGSGPKNDPKLVKEALKLGADVNIQDGSGKTPLMIACAAGNKEIVKLLLSKSADQFRKDEQGRTALFYAAQKGDEKVVDLLLDKLGGTGLQPQRLSLIEIKDVNGEDAAEYAEGFGKKDVAEKIRHEKLRMENSE